VTGKKRIFFILNPLTSLFEAFKYGFFGNGFFDLRWLGYSVLFTLIVLAFGLVIFNRVDKRFIDTV
jgi:lipopolysaccharide transport system permease protein